LHFAGGNRGRDAFGAQRQGLARRGGAVNGATPIVAAGTRSAGPRSQAGMGTLASVRGALTTW
jgi:hypothetical protein